MISVIICTRNRASLLERCLRNFTAIDHSWLSGWEIVVVDNGSCDETLKIAESFTSALPLRYAFEEKQGLSRARNRGIAESKNPIVAFTDDDCLVAPNWLEKILRNFARDISLSILGGRVVLANAEDAAIGVRWQREHTLIVEPSQILELMIGCNLAFKRSVFEEAGTFDTALGVGTPAGSAEDIDLLYRALRRGARIGYRPEMIVLHAHGRKRPEPQHIDRYIRGRGAFYCKHIGNREIVKLAYWEVRQLLLKDMAKDISSRMHVLGSLAAGAMLRVVGRDA
jgi:glycosyltransferase involved in cell wall biosynthesis